jgi:type III pantothenate kinase
VGIEIQVDYPERVGIDRLLAARAANAWNDSRCKTQKRSERTPVIVVQAGTALTVDWIDAQGRFQGGSILPGVGLALQYLAAGTDQLPWLPTDSIDRLPRLPGKNTEEAIAAGVHASLVGGVRYLVERYRNEIGGSSQIPVVISGGDGRLVLEHIATPATYVENLVLLGLALCDPL